MIIPRYMLCSEGKLVDRDTGLVSHINVIDKLLVTFDHASAGQVMAQGIRFFVSAVWSWAPDTEPSGERCDWEMLVCFPGENQPRSMCSGQFEFATPFYRVDVLFQAAFGARREVKLQSGPLRFTSRVRLTGTEEWVSQDCVIPMEVGSAGQPKESTPKEITNSD